METMPTVVSRMVCTVVGMSRMRINTESSILQAREGWNQETNTSQRVGALYSFVSGVAHLKLDYAQQLKFVNIQVTCMSISCS